MEWPLALLLIFGSLLVLMASGLPIAFSFGLVNLMGVFLFWGGESGLEQIILSVFESVTSFTLLSIPLFILMGEVLFHSGVAPYMMKTLDLWIGRIPGRLSFLAVGSGTLFATLSGSSLAATGMLGAVLVPEMEERNYKKEMIFGPIMAGGGLAIIIPPSALAVLLGALGEMSVGRLLIAIIVPGLLLALILAVYIIVRCSLQPSLAPPYKMPPTSLSKKLSDTARYVLPVGFIIFLVVGLIFLGIATPSEAAATGAFGTFILTAAYGKLNWQTVKKAVTGTIHLTVMIFMILVGSKAFSQILAFSGASRGMVEFATSFSLSPFFILIAMQVVLLVLGMIMDAISIMMVTVPIFMPIVNGLGFDPVWFAVVFLLNLEVAGISPPFGMLLFVMKGVAPPATTMMDIYSSVVPILICKIIALVLLLAAPGLCLWLPSLMR